MDCGLGSRQEQALRLYSGDFNSKRAEGEKVGSRIAARFVIKAVKNFLVELSCTVYVFSSRLSCTLIHPEISPGCARVYRVSRISGLGAFDW